MENYNITPEKKWTVTLFIDGSGKFTYFSNHPNPQMAIAITTKEMFKTWIATDPKVTRLTDIHVKPYEESDENLVSQG